MCYITTTQLFDQEMKILKREFKEHFYLWLYYDELFSAIQLHKWVDGYDHMMYGCVSCLRGVPNETTI